MQKIKTIFKSTVIICALLAIVQNTKAQNVHFGLKAAPGLYWIGGDDKVSGNGVSFGFSYGAMLEFGITENYFIVTGLDMVSAGGKTKQDVTIASTTTAITNDFTINYLQIPLFLKMKTKQIGMMKYFGQFGLGTGYALSTKSETETTVGGAAATKSSSSSTDNLFPLRASLLIGGGIEYTLSGSTCIVAGLTFDNGFTPILKDEQTTNGVTSKNPSLTSKGIVLTVGILF